MKNHSKDCSVNNNGECDCGLECPVDLQIKDFPEDIKRQVQSKAIAENKTLKRVTIELYQAYLHA
jgi:hypothetical protein